MDKLELEKEKGKEIVEEFKASQARDNLNKSQATNLSTTTNDVVESKFASVIEKTQTKVKNEDLKINNPRDQKVECCDELER